MESLSNKLRREFIKDQEIEKKEFEVYQLEAAVK